MPRPLPALPGAGDTFLQPVYSLVLNKIEPKGEQMLAGEKAAILVAVGIVISVGVFTAYLESNTTLKAGDGEANFATPDPGLIPRGINPDALPDAQGHGATLLTIYCVQCHDLPTPTMHTAEEWHAVLARMDGHIQERRASMVSRVAMPSKKDWDDLHSYLAQHGQKPIDPNAYDDLDSAEGRAFLQACSRCHAAPDPSQHLAKEWPRIVLRMKYNMSDAGRESLDEESTALVVSYLQRHSRPPQD